MKHYYHFKLFLKSYANKPSQTPSDTLKETGRINEVGLKYKALTILCLKVSEAKLGSFTGDQEFSVEGENHGFVLHVDHATNHVALFPRLSKVAAACMHTPSLEKKKHNKNHMFLSLLINGTTMLLRFL